jgi:hypothetical protein
VSAVNLCPVHFKAHIHEAIKHAERQIEWLHEQMAEAEARPEVRPPEPLALHDAMLDGFE